MDAELDFEEAQRALSKLHESMAALQHQASLALEKKRQLRQRRLRLRKEANLLTSREREMFARELASIEEMEKLEEEASASAVVGSSPNQSSGSLVPDVLDPAVAGFALSPVPSEFLGMGLPEDWSLSQYLNTDGTASGA